LKRGSIDILRGEIAAYAHTADSGSEMRREFCPICGTPLFVKSTRFPDIEMFTVSTLEDPESIEPSFEIWTSSKISWASIGDVDHFPRGALDGST